MTSSVVDNAGNDEGGGRYSCRLLISWCPNVIECVLFFSAWQSGEGRCCGTRCTCWCVLGVGPGALSSAWLICPLKPMLGHGLTHCPVSLYAPWFLSNLLDWPAAENRNHCVVKQNYKAKQSNMTHGLCVMFSLCLQNIWINKANNIIDEIECKWREGVFKLNW